jgi:hypothetical protein
MHRLFSLNPGKGKAEKNARKKVQFSRNPILPLVTQGLLVYLVDLFDIPVHGELSLKPLCIHVAYHAEYFTLPPWAIVFAKAPGNPGITAGVASVNLIFIIEIQGG